MDTRAAFDAFCRKRNLICEGERDKKLGYAYAETETAWQAYRAGALAMRERAAKKCEQAEIQTIAAKGRETAARLREAIRALPVEE